MAVERSLTPIPGGSCSLATQRYFSSRNQSPGPGLAIASEWWFQMKKGKAAMQRGTLRTSFALPAGPLAAFVALAVGLPACGSSSDDPNSINGGGGGTSATSGGEDPNNPNAPVTQTQAEAEQKLLDQRKFDYGEALRTASLKLRDRLPDLAEIKKVEAGDDAAKKVAYEALIDTMLESPEFKRTMIKFWKDTFRTGQVGAVANNVNKDAAPNFAAQLVVEGRNYTELFTATAGTCPTFDGTANTFAAADCPMPTNAVAGPTVGVLTDPGLQGQYFANMGFRRVRFVQETFVCNKFPAQISATPVPMGNGVYTGKFPFASITGKENKPDAKVDFQDTKAIVCANCHSDINHAAPLFLNWDANGALRATPQVKVPIPGEPNAARIDFLPDAEGLAWRSTPITDMASLGKALAADPDVPKCAVNRVWNYAMSRGDIVNDLASIPDGVTKPLVDKFAAGGMKMKETIRDVFKSEDFTKF